MGIKTNLTLGALAIIALLVAGISYWAMREKTQSGPPPASVAEAPSGPVQKLSTPENSSTGQATPPSPRRRLQHPH